MLDLDELRLLEQAASDVGMTTEYAALIERARRADAMEAAIRAVVRSGNPLAALAELHDFAEKELRDE